MITNRVTIPAHLLPGGGRDDLDPDPGMIAIEAIRRDLRKRDLPVDVSATYGRDTEVTYRGEQRFSIEALAVVHVHIDAR